MVTQFTHYLAQETCIPLGSNSGTRSRTFASDDDDDDDDDDSDDDDPGWLSERPFSFGRNVTATGGGGGGGGSGFRGGGFEDSFSPAAGAEDPFNDDVNPFPSLKLAC